MLLLGAGASKAVGIGDLKDLTDKVKNVIIEKGYGELLEHIINTLEKANNDFRFFSPEEVDMEVLFSILHMNPHLIS